MQGTNLDILKTALAIRIMNCERLAIEDLSEDRVDWLSPIQIFYCWTHSYFCADYCYLFDGLTKQTYNKGKFHN